MKKEYNEEREFLQEQPLPTKMQGKFLVYIYKICIIIGKILENIYS